MRILAQLKKRWRILRAALQQDWHEHRCRSCRHVWLCQGRNCRPWPDDECPDCEVAGFEEHVILKFGKVVW
jgi:hypothetical protein